MRIKEFKKELKKYGAKKMIRKHIESEIYLTNRQLEYVLNLKNKQEF